MTDPEVLWRLGRWLSEKRVGRLRFAWSGGELELALRGSAVAAIRGLESAKVAARLRFPADGSTDPYGEAPALAHRHGISEAEVLAAVKAELELALRAWLTDPARRLETTPEEVPPSRGAAISLPHVLVEILLSPAGPEIARSILPDLEVVLRRTPEFLERYASLRLSQKADLIAAKITGSRTAREIVDHSLHPHDQVVALLAALVLAGIVEPVPVAKTPEEPELALVAPPLPTETPRRRRRIRPLWLAAAAIAVILVAAAVVVLAHARKSAAANQHWGIVVDSGCQAVDHERMLRKENRFGSSARILEPADGDRDPCRQLVWGVFSTEESAKGAIGKLPGGLVSSGFEPHVIPLPGQEKHEP